MGLCEVHRPAPLKNPANTNPLPPKLLPDTKPAEYPVQKIVGVDLASDCSQLLQSDANLRSNQFVTNVVSHKISNVLQRGKSLLQTVQASSRSRWNHIACRCTLQSRRDFMAKPVKPITANRACSDQLTIR